MEDCIVDIPLGALMNQGGKSIKNDDDSSSSGEEASEEEVLHSSFFSLRENDDSIKQDYVAAKSDTATSASLQTNDDVKKVKDWWCPKKVNLSSTRNRYFGSNLELANSIIEIVLCDRLEQKVKQNSSLLSTLPDFVSIPMVRQLVSSHLEKWLQSPALSGLARWLFSCVVGGIQNVDPPLPEDVIVIDNVMSMNLKANQVRNNRFFFFQSTCTTTLWTICRHIIFTF